MMRTDESRIDGPAFLPQLYSRRYLAGSQAASDGCGEGNPWAALNDPRLCRLRRQALNWLTDDLAVWSKRAETRADASDIREAMRHWLIVRDLACVRDAAALAKLPEAEQVAWQKFWADVEALKKRCEEPPADTKPPPKP